MRVSAWIRQGHRWISMLFTATAAVNFAVRVEGGLPHGVI
jgi:hypothetical protein